MALLWGNYSAQVSIHKQNNLRIPKKNSDVYLFFAWKCLSLCQEKHSYCCYYYFLNIYLFLFIWLSQVLVAAHGI